jgi:mannose/fructose-specific phosphotransferase system component IIA
MANVNDVYKAAGARNVNGYYKSLKAIKDANEAVVALTDSSGGTPGNTIADVPGTYTEATLANQLASLTAKVNTVVANLKL